METPQQPQDIAKHYLDRMREHSKSCSRRIEYSIQRFDLLIISVSGACIYVALECLKFIHQKPMCADTTSLKWAAAMATVTILVNFASQWTGLYTNKREFQWTDHEMLYQLGADDHAEASARYEKQAARLSTWTRALNIAASALMVLSVALITRFAATTF